MMIIISGLDMVSKLVSDLMPPPATGTSPASGPFMRCLRMWLSFTVAVLLVLVGVTMSRADSPPSAGQIYAWQADDSLDRLAEKFYDDSSAWPVLLAATNARVELDGRFTKILSPTAIQVGQLLWVPEPEDVAELLAHYPSLQPLTPDLLAEFEDYVEATRVRYQIPGAAVVLVQGGEIVFAKGFGVRELGQPEPVEPDTVFAVGSTTKAMTSMMVASLVDDGLLDWDQPVVELWPDFRLSDQNRTTQLRLRHLLNMGSGLPRRDLVWSGTGLTAEQLMESLADLPVYGELGKWYDYNNQVVSTGGYVAAMAAGGEYGQLRQAYVDQLQARVLDPIGMRNATTSIDQVLQNPNRAIPHDFNLFGEASPTHYHLDESVTPAGGVYASAVDLARFLMAEMNGGITPEGRRVVSAKSLAETHRPQTKITDELGYGMGWYIEDYRGVELLWHDGNVFGFKAIMAMIPSADLGLVVLSNSILSFTFNAGVQYRLVELMFDLPPEAEENFDQRWAAFETAIVDIRRDLSVTVDPAEVAPYVGEYAGKWQVELRDDKLFATRGPYEWQLLQAEVEKFIVNNGYGIGLDLYLKEDADTGQVTMEFTLPTGEVGKYQLLPK